MRPTRPLLLASPSGNRLRAGVEQQTRRANAIAGQDHQAGLLLVHLAVGVVIDHAVGKAILAHGDLPHPRAGFEYCPVCQGLRPVGHVGAGLGPPRAANIARAAVVAGLAAVVGTRQNSAVRRPPVPAELLKASDHGVAKRAKRNRRYLPERLGRIRRVTGNTGHADHPVVEVVERLELRIGQGPVVGHAIERAHPEVGGVKTREVGTPVDGAAAHGVIHQRGDGRCRVVHRIVRRQAPEVGVGMEGTLAVQFPIVESRRVGPGIEPLPLLQAHDVDPRLTQAPGEGSA